MLKNTKRFVGAKIVWSATTRAAIVAFGEPSLTCVDRSRNQVVATGPKITDGKSGIKDGEKMWSRCISWEDQNKRGRTATIESHPSCSSKVVLSSANPLNCLLRHDIAGRE